MVKQFIQQEALRRSEERYHRMIEEVQDYAIILLDEEGIILNWNKGAAKIKGYTAYEIVGKHFRIFYRKIDQDNGLPEHLLDIARKTGRAAHEGLRVKKDGTTFWGFVVITALHDEKNNIIGFSKVTRDLTERKLAEEDLKEYAARLQEKNEELRRSEEHFHKMVAEIRDYAIILLDINGNILNWNLGAEYIKGYTAKEIIGKNFRIFYQQEDIESGLPDRLLKEGIEKGRAFHEGWRLRKDGTKFWGNIIITALHDENNNVIGFSKITRDLTDKKKSEDEMIRSMQLLEQKNNELEQFAYVASHDIKEPLRKIVAFGDLLQHNYSESLEERAKEYIIRMQKASQRMMDLIENLLEFSRIDRIAEDLKPVDLNKVVDEVLHDMEMIINHKKAKITRDNLPEISGHAIQLRQLFQNLVSNALKFNESSEPIVHISSDIVQDENVPSGTVGKIYIKDNGIGFSPEYQAKIFEVFQRLHGKAEYPGTGMGLAICKKIVENHNGNITVESEEGKGSTFIVEFPMPG
jgi:PAS domain S-box-containing protein